MSRSKQGKRHELREFRWIPGQGMDAESLARLIEHFSRPSEPMGEAWFMGERREMYPLLLGDLTQLAIDDLRRPLGEIASGWSSFGPMREWHEWYHYLLPRLLPSALEDYAWRSTIEILVTGFIAIYPNGVHTAPYKSFREDTLRTIGRCVMAPQCWNGNEIVVGKLLRRDNCNPNRIWGWWDASGDFSASMFFCLKYLPPELVAGWLRSVIAIPSPHWRAQFLVWAVGAHGMLTGQESWPSDWNEHASPQVTWDWSHVLDSGLPARDASAPVRMETLLPAAAREDVLHILVGHFTENVYLEWLESISSIDYLYAELLALPSRFEDLYVGKRAAQH